MSLVEVMMVMGLMSVLALGSASFFVNQLKSNNFIELQSKREQLRLTLLGQYLTSSDQCKCLFNGSTEFVALSSVGITLSVNPTQITRYAFTTPGDCLTASADPNPYISSVGVDGIKSSSIRMENVRWNGSSYEGDLSINIESLKDAVGPKQINLKIRTALQTTPGTPGHVVFAGCSSNSASLPTIPSLGTCPAGQVSAGYDAFGALVCRTAPALGSCAIAGQVLTGYDSATGAMICSWPTPGICPTAGEVLVGYNALTGVMVCQPPTYQ